MPIGENEQDRERLVLSHIIGEDLEEQPLRCDAHYPNGRVEEAQRFTLWIDSAPGWCEKEQKRATWQHPTFLTLYLDVSGNAPERIVTEDGVFEKLDTFNATPERECPFKDEPEDLDDQQGRNENGTCPYCGTSDDTHGMAYQGEHAEVLYRKIPRLNSLSIQLEPREEGAGSESDRRKACADALRKLAEKLDDGFITGTTHHLHLDGPTGYNLGEVELSWDT